MTACSQLIVEVLIVVGIIAIVAGIAVPSFLRAIAITKTLQSPIPPNLPAPFFITRGIGRLDTGEFEWVTPANPHLGTPIGVTVTVVPTGLFRERFFPSVADDAIPVRAMLYGDQGLEVEPLGDASTALSLRRGKTPPVWAWRVKPTETGRHQLTLVFDVCYEPRACDRVAPKPHEVIVEATVYERVANWSLQNGSKILWLLIGWVAARGERWAEGYFKRFREQRRQGGTQ
jgi:hypothetical protein